MLSGRLVVIDAESLIAYRRCWFDRTSQLRCGLGSDGCVPWFLNLRIDDACSFLIGCCVTTYSSVFKHWFTFAAVKGVFGASKIATVSVIGCWLASWNVRLLPVLTLIYCSVDETRHNSSQIRVHILLPILPCINSCVKCLHKIFISNNWVLIRFNFVFCYTFNRVIYRLPLHIRSHLFFNVRPTLKQQSLLAILNTATWRWSKILRRNIILNKVVSCNHLIPEAAHPRIPIDHLWELISRIHCLRLINEHIIFNCVSRIWVFLLNLMGFKIPFGQLNILNLSVFA